MTTRHEHFGEYFSAAQSDALGAARESRIIELRYGFTGEEPHTLAEIGAEFGVTRERIRQLLKRAHRRIRARGRNQLRNGERDAPCAALLELAESIVRPHKDGATDRLVDFSRINLSHLTLKTRALPLLAFYAYPDRRSVDRQVARAYDSFRRRRRETRELRRAEARAEARAGRFAELLGYVIWDRPAQTVTDEAMSSLRGERDITSDGEDSAGSFYSSKLGREVAYESNLEADFLKTLETNAEVVFYREQPLKVPYEHGGRARLYYPDVLFVLADGRGVVVEIKPTALMVLDRNLAKWSALRRLCAERGWGMLVTDGKHTIQQMRRRDPDEEYARAVLERLRRGPLSWTEYKQILAEHRVSMNDLCSLVLRHRLTWSLSPFALNFRQ